MVSDSQVFVGRQPILDRKKHVVGDELLSCGSASDGCARFEDQALLGDFGLGLSQLQEALERGLPLGSRAERRAVAAMSAAARPKSPGSVSW